MSKPLRKQKNYLNPFTTRSTLLQTFIVRAGRSKDKPLRTPDWSKLIKHCNLPSLSFLVQSSIVRTGKTMEGLLYALGSSFKTNMHNPSLLSFLNTKQLEYTNSIIKAQDA